MNAFTRLTLLILMMSCLLASHAQHVFHAKGGNIVMQNNSQLVFKNTSYVNGGAALQSDSATLRFSGTNTDSISGAATTFPRLAIAKTAGNLLMRTDISIGDSLILANGLIVLEDQNIDLLPDAGTDAGHAGSYVQTTGTGSFQRIVENQSVTFPIGGATFRPMILSNSGTSDNFVARVTDSVLTQGTSGNTYSSEVVGASWFVGEQTTGGSNLNMTLQWNDADELSPFDRTNAFISIYNNGWDIQTPGAASGTNPYQLTRTNLTDLGPFAIFNEDLTPPQITCPANIVQANDQDNCSAIVTFAVPQGTDNLSEPVTVLTNGLGSGATFPIGTTTEVYTVTDATGLTASCAFDITVNDTQAPEISCPQSISVSNDAGVCGSMVIYVVNTSDNCSGDQLVQTEGQASASIFPIGTTTNIFTVTDASGNTASCSFDVIVSDDEAPTISCPASLQLANDPGQCGRTVTYLMPIGQDNCSSSSTQMTTGLGSGSFFTLGSTTETYVVTDASGQTASCAFTITISDDENPAISLIGNNPVQLCEGDTYIEAGATASDNCDASVGQNLVIDNSAVNAAVEGNYVVTYTVTDVHGNSSQITRLVIVNHTPGQLASQNCGSCDEIRLDFCEGESQPDLEALLLTNNSYEPGAAFNWYADNNGVQGNAISLPTLNMSTNNKKYYWVSQSLGDCEGEARRLRARVRKTSIVVLDLPTIGCGTGQLDLAAWVSDTRGIAKGYNFYDSDPELGASPVGSVTASGGIVNSGQYAVVNLPSNSVTYYAVATNNTGCQVTGSDEVQAGSGASLDPIANITVNSGELVHVSFSSSDATHILWFDHSSFNNPDIGLTGSFGMGDLVFTADNFTSSPLTATIRAIAYNSSCAGEVRDFTITVFPGTQNRQTRNSLELEANLLNAHDVQVNWQIEYEFALEQIEIEKQLNGGEWIKIGQSELLNDQFIDHTGMGNVTKYRLKLVHADGRAIWSQEVEVNFDYYDSKRFTLYPNPSNGRFKLRAAGPLEGEWRYKLSDQLGRTILIGKLHGSETAFDISRLPTAHYFLLLTSPAGKRYVERVVKK